MVHIIAERPIKYTLLYKELLALAKKEQPLIICLDSVEQLSSGEGSNMSWLPTKLPPYCKIIGKSNF